MHPELIGIWEHIRDLGLAALAHANRHAAYWSLHNHRTSELSVLQAAHAAELLIKARIAQEHPLLIFETFPKHPNSDELLSFDTLFESGRTVQWGDLPARLWAASGKKIPNQSLFREFAKFRNGIQHFSPPNDPDPSKRTLEFIYKVIDPFINSMWGLYAIDFDEDHDPYIYLVRAIVGREIDFLVSKGAAERFEEWNVDWTEVSATYQEKIKRRVADALDSE